MFMALYRVKMEEKVFKDHFRAVNVIVRIVVSENRSNEEAWEVC